MYSIFLALITIVSSTFYPYYVSKNGSDAPNCGLNITSACGTLYFVSTLLDNITKYSKTNDNITIFIIDGQNETQIESYLDNAVDATPIYHPCLLKPLTFKAINQEILFSINFNSSNIITMNDWYPPICQQINPSQINNTHMFYIVEVPNTLLDVNISNLRINDIDFGLSSAQLMSILWINCRKFSMLKPIFSNIRCFSGLASWNYELSSFLYAETFSLLQDAVVVNISLVQSIVPFIFSANELNLDRGNWQHLNILDTVHFISSPEIWVMDTIINYTIIPPGYAIFNPTFSTISIVNSAILDINQGGIIHGQCSDTCEFINNIITTHQTLSTDNYDIKSYALIAIPSITFSVVRVSYYYDLYTHCTSNAPYTNQYAIVINVNCSSPYTLLTQNDKMNMPSFPIENIDISIIYTDNHQNVISLDDYRVYIADQYNFTQSQIEEQSVVIQFRFATYGPLFILNYPSAKIEVTNIAFYPHLFGSTVFDINPRSNNDNFWMSDGNEIYFENINVINSNSTEEWMINPNDLISNNFMEFNSIHTVFIIEHSHIFGVKNHIIYSNPRSNYYTADLNITNSRFHHALSAINVRVQSFDVGSSSFYSLGNYYTDITYYDDNQNESAVFAPFYVSINSRIMNYIEHSTFSYYSMKGILRLLNICDITLNGNTFNPNFNQSYWYKNIPSNLGFDIDLSGIVLIEYVFHESPSSGCDNVKFLSNIFEINEIDPSLPILTLSYPKYFRMGGCLSGNTFYNFALNIVNGRISSCFRPELVHWNWYNTVFYSHSGLNCSLINYGSPNFDFIDLQNEFIITNDSISVIKLDAARFAMDNIIFDILVPMNGPIIYFGKDSDFMIIDTFINNLIYMDKLVGYNQEDIKYISTYCQQYYHTSDQITQLWISYDLNNSTSVSIEYVDYLSPLTIQVAGVENNTYFPGGQFRMKYTIFDKYYNHVPRNAFATAIDYFGVNVQNIDLFISDFVAISPNVNIGCETCDKGLYFSNINMDYVNKSFNLSVSTSYLVMPLPQNITIKVITCGSEYGISSSGYQCVICSDGYFSVGDDDLCHSCDQNENNKGITCTNGDDIMVKQQYWMGFKNDNMTEIISAIAPFGQACTLNDGCNYFDNVSSLCAYNRDPSSIMCSRCIDGYSELFLSNACGKCDKTYYLWLLFPFGIAVFVVTTVLLWKSTKNEDSSNEYASLDNCNCCTRCSFGITYYLAKKQYILDMIQIMISNCILYYQQAISQIFSNSDININLAAFSAVFNLSFDDMLSSSGAGNGWCFINGMTAKQEILSGFFLIVMIFGILCIIPLVYAISKRYCCSCNIEIFGRSPHFGKAFVAILLLIIGQLLSIFFKLLSCQSVGNRLVQFYFGYEDCFGGVWIVALFGLLVICCILIIFSLMLYKMDDIQRQHDENVLRPLTVSYKPQFYYWEFVILIRRLLIAFLAISFGDDNIYPKYMLVIVLCIFLRLQSIYQPYIIHEANNMEFNLLTCIVLIIVVDIASDQFDETVIYIILSILIIFPFVSIFWWIWRYQKKIQRKKTDKDGKYIVAWNSNDQNHDINDFEAKTELSVNKIPLANMLLNTNNKKRYDSFSSDQ